MLTSDMHVLPSVGVWNDEKNAYIGSIELHKVVSNVGKVYNNHKHIGSQTSTYNYASKQLSFVVRDMTTQIKYLYSVDTTSWREIYKSSIGEEDNYTGLAYDNTTDAYNLFGTFTNKSEGNKLIHVCKISPLDHIAKKHHSFEGDLCSTVFNSKTKTYFVFYTKPLNLTQIFVNSYDITGKPIEIDQHYEVKNVGSGFKPIPSTLMNLAYIENKDLIVCNIIVESNVKKGPEIFHISTTNKTITNYNWNGSEGLLCQFKESHALFSDLKLPRIYQIAETNDGLTKLYTYSTYNNRFQEIKRFNIKVTAIWELA